MKKLLVLLLSLLVVVGCTKKPAAPADEPKEPTKEPATTQIFNSDKLHVTVTTTFLEDMINQLAKDFVEVALIIPAGEDPHTYEPKPVDFNKLSEADMIFYHGLHFEGHMIDLLEQNHGFAVTRNFDMSNILPFEEEDGSTTQDPHFWFNIDYYKLATETMANDLAAKLVDHKDAIMANLESYLKQLDELKEYATTHIAEIPKENRVLITPHDAFSYFSKQYDIEVVAPQGVSTDSELDINKLQETVDFLVKRQVKAIFAESTTDPKRMEKIKESAKAQGFDVKVVSGEGNELYSDSLAPKGQKGDTYIDMVKHNVDLIVANLK